MPAAKRRIKKARIHTISLCERGANQLPVLYKDESGQESVRLETLIKDDRLEDQGELLAVVWSPEKIDAFGDVASEEVVKDMAYEFARNGLGNISIKHNGIPLKKEQAFVAQSFIIQKEDSRFKNMKDYSGNPVDVTGGWAVLVKLEDEQLKRFYKENKWNGVSMEGPAIVSMEKQESSVSGFLNMLLKAAGLSQPLTDTPAITENGELKMTKEEIAAMFAENNKMVLSEMRKMVRATAYTEELLKSAGVAESDSDEVVRLKVELYKAKNEEASNEKAKNLNKSAPEKPVFKGDLSDAAAVSKFSRELAEWEIISKMDPSDLKSVQAASEALLELRKNDPEENEDQQDLNGHRPAPTNQKPKASVTNLAKEEDYIKAGDSIAKLINSSGY